MQQNRVNLNKLNLKEVSGVIYYAILYNSNCSNFLPLNASAENCFKSVPLVNYLLFLYTYQYTSTLSCIPDIINLHISSTRTISIDQNCTYTRNKWEKILPDRSSCNNSYV